MARVIGAKGTINEGAIGDVMEFDPTTGTDAESNPERWSPGPEPAHTEVQLADAIVRGDLISHPLDQAAIDRMGLEDRALDVVLTDDPNAGKGDHVVSRDDDQKRARAYPVAHVKSEHKKVEAELAATTVDPPRNAVGELGESSGGDSGSSRKSAAKKDEDKKDA